MVSEAPIQQPWSRPELPNQESRFLPMRNSFSIEEESVDV